MAFDLLESVKHNAHKNQERGATEELCKLTADAKIDCKGGEYGYNGKKY